MTSYLIDINLWIAMTWGQHRHHREACKWMNSKPDARFLFCRFTMLGFLRLLTNQTVMGDDTLALSDALGLYDAWMEDPRVEFGVELRQTETLFRQALAPFGSQPATKAIADCYLVGFAEVNGASIATLDKALAKTAQMRQVPADLLEGAM
jgi:toxin-antitoxin system PIN domain toxin